MKIKLAAKIVSYCILGAVVIYLLACFLDKDDPVVNDQDLKIVREPLADVDNGYIYLLEMDKKFVPLAENSPLYNKVPEPLSTPDLDPNLVENYIQQNQEALKLAEQADQCLRYQGLEIHTLADQTYSFSNFFNLANLRVWRAFDWQNQGKENEAITECLHIMEMGRKLQDAKYNMVLETIGIVVQRIGANALGEIVSRSKSEHSTLSKALKSDELFSTSREGLTSAFQNEYQSVFLWMINSYISIGSNPKAKFTYLVVFSPTFFKPNRTKNEGAEIYRNWIARTSSPFSKKERDALKKFVDQKRNWWNFFLNTNPLGHYIFARMATCDGYWQYAKNFAEANSKLAEAHVLLALKAYQLKNGILPDKLEALVPDYLDKIPTDSFEGEPIHYSKEEKKLWFAGVNGVIDDSKAHEFDRTVLPIPF